MKNCLVLLLCCVFAVLGTQLNAANWDGGAGTDDWMTAANWEGDVLPTGANVWMDNSDTAVLYSGDSDTIGMFFPGGTGGVELTIEGTLTTTGRVRIADTINTSGTITVDGGTLNVPDHIYVGSAYLAGNISASGTLIVKNGGVVNQTLNGYGLKVPAHYADVNTSGLVEVYDGTIYTVDLFVGSNGLIRLGSGSIIIEGNEFTEVNNYVSSGNIVPMDSNTVALDVSYDGTNTIITAEPLLYVSPYSDKWGTAALWHFDELISGSTNKMTADDDILTPGRDRDLTFCEGLNPVSSGGAALVDPAVLGTLDFPAGDPNFGKCLQFDGIDDLLRYDGDRDFLEYDPDNVRIEAWVRLDDDFEPFGGNIEYYIFSSYNQIGFRVIDTDGTNDGIKLAYVVLPNEGGTYWNSNKSYSDIGVDPKQWHHVALTSYQNNLTVEVNGQVIDSRTLTLGVNSDPASAGQYVGAYNTYGQKPFWGYMDEVRVSEAVETDPVCGYWGYQDADIDQDCVVDINDLAYMVTDWLLDSDLDSGADDPMERGLEQLGNYNVPAATITPTIDGVVSAGEWSDAKPIEMVYPAFSTSPNVGTVRPGTPPADNDADFSLFWYAKWDNGNLYLMGRVFDDIYNAAAGEDEPQLCFNFGDAGTSYLIDACVWNLAVDGTINTNTTDPSAYAPVNTNLAGSVTADGYVVELALAWDDFDAGYTPAANDIHGFGLACQDHDAGGLREHFYLDFGAGEVAMNDLSTWNTITLVNTLASGEMGYYETDVDLDTEVNLHDFAKLGEVWLSCTDPLDENCVNVKF